MKSNVDISDHKSQPSPFESIYQAAIQQNTEVITALLSHSCIDIRNAKISTPVCKLAFEGNVTAVNFLRTKFKSSLSWIVAGYVQGRYFDEAKKILVLASNSVQRRELLGGLLSGYAQHTQMEDANKILDSASNSAERDYFLDQMAYGYARTGQVDNVNKVIASIPAEKIYLLKNAACAYACGGVRDR